MTLQIPDDDAVLYTKHLQNVLDTLFPSEDKSLNISILVCKDLMMKIGRHPNGQETVSKTAAQQ